MKIIVDGAAVPAAQGQSVGAAMVNAGRRAWRTSRKQGRPRGLFCGIGVCYDCLVTVDGRPNQRACLVTVTDGMTVTTDSTAPGETLRDPEPRSSHPPSSAEEPT